MRRVHTLFLLICAALTVWGCPKATPEERVAQARARYSVTLNGFFAKEEPMPEVAAATEAAGEAAAAAVAEEAAVASEEAAEGEEEAEEMEMDGPRPVDVLLDLIVQHDMDTALPGITVDLTMVDADKTEKGAWRIWIETDGLPKANQKQITHILEGVNYEDGDGFSVEIRSRIPAEELGAYREFAEAAP